MATKKQINQAAKAGEITKNEQKLLIAAVDRAAKTNSSISASETARLNQALEQAKTSAIAKGGVTAKQLLGTAAERREEFGITPGDKKTLDDNKETYDEYLKRQAEEAKRQDRTNWKEFFRLTLTEWGVPQLTDQAMGFVDKGFTGDTVILKLQETDAWKQRFSANEQRKAKGLGIIDPATYLALESTYTSAMRAAGLPKGFYDELTDFTNLIAADVSPAELNQRINVATDFIDTADPMFKQQLKRFYNMTEGDMIAYALDPERALPLLERKANTIKFATEGARQGLDVSLGTAETYAGLGVGQEEARTGFEQVAQISPEAQRLSAVFAGQEAEVGQEDVISAVFGGEGSAQQKKRLQRLSESEQSLFAGQSGVGRGSLGRSQTGQF
jgi:hypothetical protein